MHPPVPCPQCQYFAQECLKPEITHIMTSYDVVTSRSDVVSCHTMLYHVMTETWINESESWPLTYDLDL